MTIPPPIIPPRTLSVIAPIINDAIIPYNKGDATSISRTAHDEIPMRY